MIKRPDKLLLSTRNPDKLEEMQVLLAGMSMEILSLSNWPEIPEVVEDADTLEGNALKKAVEVFKATGIPTLADDTGLEVRALNGEPGIYAARYAGPHATYGDNRRKLLRELEGVSDRIARFRTVAVYFDGVHSFSFTGICNGQILIRETGENGFGYDPIFCPEGFDLSFAELSASTKNEISHRGRALQAFQQALIESEL